jgi:hypothetical protein
MGRKKDGSINEETIRIRLSTEVLKRIQVAKEPSGWGVEADSSFARHLMVMGLQEAESEIAARNARYEAKIQNAAKFGGYEKEMLEQPDKKVAGKNP